VTLDTITSGSTDYVFFCGSASLASLLGPTERISALEHHERYPDDASAPTIIDVRDKTQFEICNLENSINIPISTILSSSTPSKTENGDADHESPLPPWIPSEVVNSNHPVYVVCRLGNDSQIAVKKMKDAGLHQDGQRFIGDIRGGFRAWRDEVDPDWPEY
jgi:adenylyltransferase/sulfurtransferase